MILLLLIVLGVAQEYDNWLVLQKARLMLIEDDQIDESVDLFNQVIAASSQDEAIYSEALYWKGRALYQQGFKEHAREEMMEASKNYKIRSEVLYFLQQSGAWEQRIEKIPYEGNSWVNVTGVPDEQPSLSWLTAFDVKASRFSVVEVWVLSEVFPINVTIELIDWRNERWVWSGVLRDASQPLHLQVHQFRPPREDADFLYRNMLVSAEGLDGRRIPISLPLLRVQ